MARVEEALRRAELRWETERLWRAAEMPLPAPTSRTTSPGRPFPARIATVEPHPIAPDPAKPDIVVTIEETSATERLELFGRALALTPREYRLVGRLATGADTRAMARQMALSEHTVQDHLKSIFTKTGARDRVAVLARALGTGRTPHR